MKRFLGIVRVSLAAAVALWGRESFADDGICDEASAATIDGIPAYAMCTVASTSDVWSNDGVHTAISPGAGSGWVQTAYGNGYQCTELAGRYMQFVWSVSPDWLNGDAKDICSLPLPSSLEITMTPVHGDLAVFPGGCDGASTTTGHVAVVNTVSASKISVVQQNVAGTGNDSTSCIACYVHAIANTGIAVDAGAPDAGKDASASHEPDASTESDASTMDASVAESDASEASDATALAYDAGSAPQGADAAAEPVESGATDDGFGAMTQSSGCALSSVSPAGGSPALALLAGACVAATRRRRRRR
jgi:hypothetical protein